jgi:hypothetical protein
LKGLAFIYLAALLPGPAASAQAAGASEEWHAAILEIEGARCIGKLCLGMTLGQAEDLFGPATQGTVQDWGLGCDSDTSPNREATFVDHHRNKYELSFILFPGSASIRDRYRVTSISVTIDHGRTIKEILFDGLVSQWGLIQSSRQQAPSTFIWSRTDRWSVTELRQIDIDASDAALLKASLEFPRHAAWLEDGRVCRHS